MCGRTSLFYRGRFLVIISDAGYDTEALTAGGARPPFQLDPLERAYPIFGDSRRVTKTLLKLQALRAL